MSQHPTKRIAIKSADVDEMMVPVIEWLNGFHSVQTDHCCQGDPDGPEPYVMFRCQDVLDLVKILHVVQKCAAVEVDWFAEGVCLRYRMEFFNQDFLRMLVSSLQGIFEPVGVGPVRAKHRERVEGLFNEQA